jgi:hypothetical protein
MNIENNNIIQSQLSGNLPKPYKTGVDWYLFAWFANYFSNTNMLEIGAGDGGSSATMAAFAKQLIIIDNWHQGWQKQAVEKFVVDFRMPVQFIDSLSNKVDASKLTYYKFVHLDANKDYNGVIEDLYLTEEICTGVICVDDYLQSMWPEVTWAVDDWLKQNDWQRILTGNHQVFLAKDSMKIQEIVVDWPVVNRGHGYHLTYGKYPDSNVVNKFINAGAMKYSWHEHAKK